jgi:CheY-like chemotaxis protein
MQIHIPHFLLVEDNMSHAELVRESMVMNRFANQLDCVETAEDALVYLEDWVKTESEDRQLIILLDLKLPYMSGIEFLRKIKSHPKYRPIPVVILTTSDAESDRIEAYEAYANSYLNKPLEFDKFQGMVQQLGLYWGIVNAQTH